MATDAVLSFAIDRLGTLLLQEAKLLIGVGDQVKALQDDLKRLVCFLKDAETRELDHQTVRSWIEQAREVAYDAEDVIETFVLKVALKVAPRLGWTLMESRCVPTNPATLYKIGHEIEGIKTRLSSIISSMQPYGIHEVLSVNGSSSRRRKKWMERRETFPDVPEQNLVDMEQTVGNLVEGLLSEDRFSVLLICGMGGVGKTTLAKEIYNHPKVRKHFDSFAWVFVSQEFERCEIWRMLLGRLYPKSNAQHAWYLREQELVTEIFRYMTIHKCLVVLDDIWSSKDWDNLKEAVPYDSQSKIIFTSRSKYIVSESVLDTSIHETQCLDDESSWELFRQKALIRRNADGVDDKSRFEELGKQMVKSCGGLPLAIKAIGGLLGRTSSFNEWQKVQQNIKIRITWGFGNKDGDDSILRVLSLSYDALPPDLKSCFLYLALFPKDYEISVDKLTKLWMAEGFISDDEGWTVEECAESCFSELVERGMITGGSRDIATSRFSTCQMHDVMREICLRKAREDGFAEVINPVAEDADCEDHPYSRSVYRFSVPLYRMTEKSYFRQDSIRSRRLRSLLYLHYNTNSTIINKSTWPLAQPGVKDFSSLRVLDMEGVAPVDNKLLKDIGKLIHLRFLSFKAGRVSSFPESLGNLKLLETLDLRVVVEAYVPNVIWKMKRLRHLYLPMTFNLKSSLRLDTLRNLQTLHNFQLGICDLRDLCQMKRLKCLKIHRSRKARNVQDVMPSYLHDPLSHLITLTVGGSEDFKCPPVDVSQILLAYTNLQMLTLLLRVVGLPPANYFPRNITYILFGNCEMKEDPMPILEKLPSLNYLKLASNAYVGKIMVCAKQGFPVLHSLTLSSLLEIGEWQVEEGAMPKLSSLLISDCPKLKKIPDALQGMQNLEEMEISRMPRAFKNRLLEEDSYKVQHIPSIVFSLCDKDEDY